MSTREVSRLRRTSPKAGAYVKHEDHLALWRVVEGAVVDAFRNHPDYLTAKGRRSAVESVTKRAVGAIVSRAKEVRKDGRLGGSCAARSDKPGTPLSIGGAAPTPGARRASEGAAFAHGAAPDPSSQNARILAHLRTGKRITGLEALTRFGCIHLPRRIKDLKEGGHAIADEWVRDERTGKRFKEYRLA